jgi:hypothetical protein
LTSPAAASGRAAPGPALSRGDRERFRDRGVLLLRQWLPAARVDAAVRATQAYFERRGLWQGSGWQLAGLPEDRSVNAGAALVRGLKHEPSHRELITTELRTLVGELVDDPEAVALTDSPQLLFTLPNAARWTVPASIWHLDIPRLGDDAVPGVQAFTFLGEVAPGGGGTLVVAGSHRLLNTGQRVRSKDVKKRLRRKPYFTTLMDRQAPDRAGLLGQLAEVDGVPVEVVELTGRPGDVYLTDLRLLHTLAPNASRVPRIMLTQRFLRASLHQQVYAGTMNVEPGAGAARAASRDAEGAAAC